MKILTAFTLLLLGYSITIAQSKQSALITAKTEPPILLDRAGGRVSFGMTEDKYKKLPASTWAAPNYIQIKRQPKRLTADARFGYNLSIKGKNIGWILYGNQTRGYSLYADWNADGDLTNNTPIKFKKIHDTYLYRKTLVERIGNQK